MVGHFHGSLTNVGIELNLGELRLGLKSLSFLSRLSLLGNCVSLLIAQE